MSSYRSYRAQPPKRFWGPIGGGGKSEKKNQKSLLAELPRQISPLCFTVIYRMYLKPLISLHSCTPYVYYAIFQKK